MKKIIFLIYTVFIITFFSSCMKEYPNDSDVRREVKLKASIKYLSNVSSLPTRVVNDVWEDGDSIGVFMKKTGGVLKYPALAENIKFTTNGLGVFSCNTLSNKIYFPSNEEDVDFISYYPYENNLNGLNYHLDLTDQSDLSNIDLLYSNNVTAVNSSTESVTLNFNHQLSKVILKISHENSDIVFTNLVAKITNVNTKGVFSLVDGLLVETSDANDVFFNVNVNKEVAEVILFPDDDLTNKSLIITIDESTYTYPLIKSTVITSFEKSKISQFTITIMDDEVSIIQDVSATIKDWETENDSFEISKDPPPGSSDGVFPTDTVAVDNPVDSLPGDGTKDNPYNIKEALRLERGLNDIWVKGYIVGGYESSFNPDKFTFISSGSSSSTLALAFSKTDILPDIFLPVNLSGSVTVRENLNFKNNSTHLGKEVLIKGQISWYFMENGPLGLVAIKEAFLDGFHYK